MPQLAFAAEQVPGDQLTLQVGLVVDRFLQAARRCGLLIDGDDRSSLEDLMAVAAKAENRLTTQARRIELLETLSLTDELTGLLNRRGFEREFKRLLASARRHDEGGMIALLDLDDFKSINDIHGHAGGDAVLAAVGQTLSQLVRETDLVARLGGDEFAVVFGRCATAGSVGRIGQLEAALNNLMVSYGAQRVPVHCSIGVTSFDYTDDFASLMKRVDTAMYMRKHRRRRVQASAPLPIGGFAAAE